MLQNKGRSAWLCFPFSCLSGANPRADAKMSALPRTAQVCRIRSKARNSPFGSEVESGPLLPLTPTISAAAQLYRTYHSCAAPHLRAAIDASADFRILRCKFIYSLVNIAKCVARRGARLPVSRTRRRSLEFFLVRTCIAYDARFRARGHGHDDSPNRHQRASFGSVAQ